MRVLIIGNLGYCGSALEPYLKSQGHEVDGMDIGWFNNNKIDQPPLDYKYYASYLFKDYEAVILLAGFSSVAMCTDLYQTLEANVFNATKLMQALRHTGTKLIYISSASCYGASASPMPCHEDDQLPKPMNYYDMSKQMLDQVAQASGLDYYSLRLATVCGWSPNIRLDLMANAMAFSAVTEGKVKVANGPVTRSILAIGDLCRAVERILDHPKRPGVYNLASFTNTVANIGWYMAGYFDVEVEEQPPSPTYMFNLDTSKFKHTFSFDFKQDMASIAYNLYEYKHRLKLIGDLGLQDNYKRLAR